MNAQIGRPPKEITKSVNIGFRLTEETAEKLKLCAELTKTSRTAVVEQGIEMVYQSLKKQ